MKIFATICASAALMAPMGASAQDLNAKPVMGTIVLEAGFPDDPRTATVYSGGEVNAAEAIPGCVGYISEPPDIRLTYTGDPGPSALPLFIHVKSDGDTTLVVNGPDGNWYCNDDGMNGSNPMVVFGPAMSGNYEIWLGSYEEGENHEAVLAFSELGPALEPLDTPLAASQGR